MRGRLHLCPYDALLKHLTGSGGVLDIGCGFGHFAWYLAERKPGFAYYGSDIDGRKVELARACPATGVFPAPVFRAGDAAAMGDWPASFGNIVLIDVLYLMPWEMQSGLLEWALGKLAPGAESALVIKSMDAPAGFSGWRALAEEWVMVHVLRRTRSSGTLLGARPAEAYRDFASARGFRCEVETLPTFNPTFIARIHR
jgi:SAM-dependent methyltransferase